VQTAKPTRQSQILRCFVPNCTTCVHSFLLLMHHDIPFRWDEHAQTTFEDLKVALSNAPLIILADYDCHYILYLSASAVSVAGILIQLGDDGHEHVIYYVSKNISGPPLNYNHKEKLSLAVVLTIQKLHNYILLRTTKVVVDYNPMKCLLSRRKITGKFTWWIVILQEYDLKFLTPKIKKALVLTKLIMEFPSYYTSSPVNTDFLDEHLFYIPSDDPWYGDLLVYLQT
jgi:hypothetical protein